MSSTALHELRLVFADQNLAESVFELLSQSRSIGGFTFSPDSSQDIEDHYFDTPGRSLQASRTSLRLRHWRDTGRLAWQWKHPEGESADNLKYALGEWDVSSFAGTGTEPVLPTELMMAVDSALGNACSDLQSVGTVRIIRQIVGVARKTNEVARLDLDRVEIDAPGSDHSVETSEVEIKGFDPLELVYLGETLANWFGLLRVRSSKLERHLPACGLASRLLLDMDPGVDDLLALLYLLASPDRPAIDGITIVGGNVPVRQCARNAFRILRWAQQRGFVDDIPKIGIGVDLSGGRIDASNVHGPDGMGGLMTWTQIDKEFESFTLDDACKLQRDVLLAHPNEVTIVATGPCSNLAELIDRDPEALRNAREIIVMGGAFFDCGNRGPRAEFNIHSDSSAARKLLDFCRTSPADLPDNGHLPLTFVGLDVTHRVILDRTSIAAAASEMGRLAASISSHYMDFYRMVLGVDGCPLHDPLTMACAIRPELLVREPYHVEIVSALDAPEVDGITIADHRPCAIFKDSKKAVTQVAVSVNSAAFLKEFLDSMGKTT